MSTVSFNSQQQGVQDLLAALPSPAKPPICLWCEEDASSDAKPGFEDFLRDSTQSQQPAVREDASEAVDAPLQDEAGQVEQAVADQSDESDLDTQANDATEDSTQDQSESTDSKQDGEQAGSENGGNQSEENADEAQLQAAANAAAAQLNVVEAVASDQPKVQVQANATQQLNSDQVKQSESGEKASNGKQSAAGNLSVNAALPTPSQASSGQAQSTTSTAALPTLQPGDQSQTNSGDTRGDSKAANASASTAASASTSSNAATTAAFSVPDQTGNESRLPLTTTATTQSVDGARQAQAQTGLSTSDNDSLNTARLTRGLANAVQQRGGAVTMRLTPPEMGTVRIQMQITGTNVSATFHAESASAQTLLTNQLAQLRSSLESKGMSVERLSVQPLAATASSQNANQSQNQSDSQQGQSQQQSAGDGRSRGQYNGSSGRDSSDQQQDNGSGQQARRGFFDRLSDAAEQDAA